MLHRRTLLRLLVARSPLLTPKEMSYREQINSLERELGDAHGYIDELRETLAIAYDVIE